MRVVDAFSSSKLADENGEGGSESPVSAPGDPPSVFNFTDRAGGDEGNRTPVQEYITIGFSERSL